MHPREARLEQELAALRSRHRYRRRRTHQGPQQPRLAHSGGEWLAFSSNAYLVLANHPRVVEALATGARRWGAGAGAAHLVNGHSAAHHALEEALARYTGYPRALLFSTGYHANLAVLGTLAERGDLLLQDKLNHASLLDGGRLSRARMQRYRHGDIAHLRELLEPAPPGRAMVATDGVFSMDGDLAPLRELAALANSRGDWLMVDDAHGFGVLGDGRGSVAEAGLRPDQVPIYMATLGKACGVFGAFVAGSETLIETLINRARPYVYTTALPPALAEATLAALELIEQEPERRQRLQDRIAQLRKGACELGLPLAPSATAIQPLILGDDATALAWATALEARGILVTAIRPPTVPEGKARLRIALSTAHSSADVDRLLEALARLQHQPPQLQDTA